MMKLGERQIAMLNMMNPEWISSISKIPRSDLVVLESLEIKGLVYFNNGKWYITEHGIAQKRPTNEN